MIEARRSEMARVVKAGSGLWLLSRVVAAVLAFAAIAPAGQDFYPSAEPDPEFSAKHNPEFSAKHNLEFSAELDPLLPPLAEPPPTVADLDMLFPQAVRAGYDRGFFIASDDCGEGPFRLQINLQNQFRYFGFAKSEDQWTDAAGNVRPIANRNDFDIVRGRLIFSGHAIDPDLNYYANLDYATVGDDRVTILLAWIQYRFSRGFEMYFGKGKVPGGREWLITSMASHSPDRSMATTFFRPSITTGMWAAGEPLDNVHYQALIGNGFNTASSGFRDLDTNFVYSGIASWEPWGPFGNLYSDLEYRDQAVVRFGTSLTGSRQSGSQFDSSQPEETFIRLSDGTDLTETGALAPGVLVNDYSILLSTYDVGLKYRGVSLTGEYFLRWLSDIRGTGPIAGPNQNLFDHGFYAQAGLFVVPKQLELFSRTSQVYGPFGNGSEYGGGINWFLRGTEHWRFGLDVTRLIRSPAQQIRTGYEAGASGILVRAQLQTMF